MKSPMFSSEIYVNRRKQLKKTLKHGFVLFPGNGETPYNYLSNTYAFRQDSNFLYYFGIDEPDMFGVIDIDNDIDILAGNEVSIEDIVWTGSVPGMAELASSCGADRHILLNSLSALITKATTAGSRLHFAKPYRAETALLLEKYTGIHHDSLHKFVSLDLVYAIAAQRLIKEDVEVNEIEKMVHVAYKMHTTAMRMAKPGVVEREIASAVEGIALSGGGPLPFSVICTVRGEIQHNHHHFNTLQGNQMLITDAGAESALHYASDITRTTPVGGRFSSLQKDIYSIVLNANLNAIKAIEPGKYYKEVHLIAAKTVAEGLSQLGIMKGNVDDVVAEGAHAMFFVHGIGHQLGMDVHDLEGLGEDNIGYDETISRSTQFGTAYLRFGRKVEPGMVLTVEPGIYFIPELFKLWKAEGRFRDFINYDKAEKLLGFGGIRIEDDVLVTNSGSRVLGPGIPKEINEVEQMALS
jgi:Xaa-Pro aminopeptidase